LRPSAGKAVTKLKLFDQMEELQQQPQRSPWMSAIMIFLTALLGFMIIGPLIGFFIALPLTGYSMLEFVDKLEHATNNPEIKVPYFVIQGCATMGLALIPYLYVRAKEKINLADLFKSKVTVITFLVAMGIVIFFMGFNSVVIEWNSKISFPEFLKGFESWARKTEDLATELTKYLTQFDSVGQFIIALTVVAVFAGIAEEMVFRGLLQPALHRATKNIHVAIWVSAILFSALHMQFFGFVPRVLLGALFGYLYYWSGNLAVPMFAHFVNNGFSVIAMYLVQQKIADIDVESTEAASWPIVITFTLLTAVLLFYFKKQTDASNSSPA
jgi:membrane protease YdiL (CAAX protease family)